MQPTTRRRRPFRSLALGGALALVGHLALDTGPARGAPADIGNPHFFYLFSTQVVTIEGGLDGLELDRFEQDGGVIYDKLEIGDFQDLIPEMEVFSEEGAMQFWIAAEAPHTLPDPLLGPGVWVQSHTTLAIYQSFKKDAPDASLSFTIPRARLRGLDSSLAGDAGPAGDAKQVMVELGVQVEAYDGQNIFEFIDFWRLEGQGRANDGPGPCDPPCWSLIPLYELLPMAVSTGGLDQGYVEVTLSAPFTQEVDISTVGVGKEFTFKYQMFATARDTAQVDTGGAATFKDPLDPDAGSYFEFTGLTPTDNPIVVPEPGRTALLLAGGAVLLGLRGASRRSRPGPPGRSPSPRGLARELAALRAFPITHP